MDREFLVAGMRDWSQRPLARALLLSAALHLALIMVIQPAGRSRVENVVIDARLVPLPVPAQAPVSAPPSPQAEPAPQPEPGREEAPAQTPPQMPAAPVGAPTQTAPVPAQAATLGPARTQGDAGAQAAAETESPLPRVPVMEDTTWYTARQVDRRPTPLDPRLPAYPEEARQRGIQGSVLVEVQIDQFGTVQDLEIIDSDPPGVFDDAVREAYAGTRYAPAIREGQPVRYRGRYRVTFELD